MRTLSRTVILALAGVAGVAAVYTLLPTMSQPTGEMKGETKAASSKVGVTRPKRRDLERTLLVPGDLRPYQETDVYARVSGYLEWIGVDRGDRVTAGQALAKLDVPEMAREYRRAEADMEMKHKVYLRLARIRKKNRDLLALEDVEQARTAFEMAKANRDELDVMMGYATVRAPFDGVVTTRHVHPGALIQAGAHEKGRGTPVVTVKDLSRLRITVAVPESEVGWISHDTLVEIELDARSRERYSGTVTRYASALDPETRTMATEIQIDNPDRRLYPGMYAHVRFILESRPDRLTVPREAVQREAVQEAEDGQEVWIVDEGIVKAMPIRTGYADAKMVEVTEGLTGSEDVIVQGRHRVRPGDPVTIYSATRRQKAPGPGPAPAGKE